MLCPESMEDRFWAKVNKTDTCWLWTAYKDQKGYGIFQMDGPKKAHRISYQLIKARRVRKGFELDHLCKNKSCVNPDHLEQVTTWMNTHRAENTIAYKNSSKTHCPKGHEYKGANLVFSKNRYNGARRCRICKNLQERKRDQSKRKELFAIKLIGILSPS